MNPKRQPAQWGKTVEVDGFILAMMGKQKKNPRSVYLGLVSDENCEARPRGKRATPHSNVCTKEAAGWLHAGKALTKFFGKGRLAKTYLPSVYLMKYFCLVAPSPAGQ